MDGILGELMQAALGADAARRAAALRTLKNEAVPPQSSGPLLLNMGAAAEYLGVSRVTLWRLIRDKRIGTVAILNGSRRVRRAELESFAGGRP